jgi:hypothetical protein
MPRKVFQVVAKNPSDDEQIEIRDFGNDSVLIVSREFANAIDPHALGQAPVSKIMTYVMGNRGGSKMAVKKS